jgi:hypothetical protein
MEDFIEKLKEYFKENSREKILKDWESTRHYDNVGITTEDFISNSKKIRKEYLKNKVKIILSEGDAGWYTQHQNLQLLFSPVIIKMIERNQQDLITEELINQIAGQEVKLYYPEEVHDLFIEEVEKDKEFRILKWDNLEVVEYKEYFNYIKA